MDYLKLLQKSYKFKIYSKFLKAIKEYDLIQENDNIAVCVSGGKDSFLMALCFKTILKHSDFPFNVKYLLMDPGYSKDDLNSILNNAKLLDINLTIFKTNIFKISNEQEKNKCYICAKMRRGALYNKAKELGCNKIALAHHMNDVNETLLMSIIYSGEVSGMLPLVNSLNYKGMKLIRPMYYVNEDDIINYSKDAELNFLKCSCYLTKDKIRCESSKRQVIKKIIKELDGGSNLVNKNIINSMKNVNMNKMISINNKGETD